MTLKVGQVYRGTFGSELIARDLKVTRIRLHEDGQAKIDYLIAPKALRFLPEPFRWYLAMEWHSDTAEEFIAQIDKAKELESMIADEKTKWRDTDSVEVRYR